MIFTTNKNSQTIIYKSPENKINGLRNTLPLPINRQMVNPTMKPAPIQREAIHHNPSITKEREYKPNTYDPLLPKPMKWGEPTWFFFHTIAQKVKPESFPFIREELLNLCFSICVNLPCSICAKHAKEYMTKINYLSVNSKEEFKSLFYNFHNTVNARKNYQQFPRELLDEKYSSANTIAILRNFVKHYEEKYHIMRLMNDQMQRIKISDQLKKWFNENMVHFEL
jgi:hypothetical protein